MATPPKRPSEFPPRTHLNTSQAEDTGRTPPKRLRGEDPPALQKASEVLEELHNLVLLEEEIEERAKRIRAYAQNSKEQRALVDSYLAVVSAPLAKRLFPYRAPEETKKAEKEGKAPEPEKKGKKFPEGKKEKEKKMREKLEVYLVSLQTAEAEVKARVGGMLALQLQARELWKNGDEAGYLKMEKEWEAEVEAEKAKISTMRE